MEKIILEKMNFYAYHGCFEQEKIVGANYEITLSLEVDCMQACLTDNLSYTINYQEVYDLVKKEMAIKSNLIEHAGQRIVSAIKSCFPQIKKVELWLSKLNPPLGGQVNRVTIQMVR